MKKTYIAPLTAVVKINAEQMICDSQVRISGAKYNGTATIESKDDDFDSSDDLW